MPAAPLPPDTRVVVTHVEGVARELAGFVHAVAVAVAGSFAVRVPFGDARWAPRVSCGRGSTQTAGDRREIHVRLEDVDGLTLPLPR